MREVNPYSRLHVRTRFHVHFPLVCDRVGDQILGINGKDVSRMSRVDVVQILQLFTVRAVLDVKQVRSLVLQGMVPGESVADGAPSLRMQSFEVSVGQNMFLHSAAFDMDASTKLLIGKDDGAFFVNAHNGIHMLSVKNGGMAQHHKIVKKADAGDNFYTVESAGQSYGRSATLEQVMLGCVTHLFLSPVCRRQRQIERRNKPRGAPKPT